MDGNLAAAFGKVLRARRTAAGLSQQELAFGADLDRTYISLLERGIRQPSLTVIFSLSRTLDERPERLVSATREALAD